MTRMSLGSHNHLAVSLAPPRLYFTGLKTLRAPTSMPTPLFVRKRCPLTAQNPAPIPFRWATGSTFLSACRGPFKYPPCPAAFARPFSLPGTRGNRAFCSLTTTILGPVLRRGVAGYPEDLLPGGSRRLVQPQRRPGRWWAAWQVSDSG